MTNSYNFNDESSMKNLPMIKERVSLVSAHMYKQFLDYQHANSNTNEIFRQMLECLIAFADALKQSFASRGISTQNIYIEKDPQNTTAVFTIFWHTFSFTTRCNNMPQALFRENDAPLFAGRIMAIKGDYNELVKNINGHKEEMKLLLENEIASLFIPAEKSQSSVFKIKHRANREFHLTQVDAAREFALTVIEAICGGHIYHEEGIRKSFNI